jgi:hypothetical protein
VSDYRVLIALRLGTSLKSNRQYLPPGDVSRHRVFLTATILAILGHPLIYFDFRTPIDLFETIFGTPIYFLFKDTHQHTHQTWLRFMRAISDVL